MIHLVEVDSTNAHLKRLAAEGAADFTAVRADRQTAGYGQRGRAWASPGAGLYLSVLVPLPAPPTLLPLAAGLAARDAVAPHTAEAGLKWVNDVVARGRKLGGVMVEASRGRAVVGVGLNVATPSVEGAIGLDALTATPPSVESLAGAVVDALRARLEAWRADGPDGLLAAWRGASVVLGREVTVDGVAGRAEDVGPHGELLLRLPDGTRRAIVAGTLRMADGAYC